MGRIDRDATKQRVSFPARSPFFGTGPLGGLAGWLVCFSILAGGWAAMLTGSGLGCIVYLLALPAVTVVLAPRQVCPPGATACCSSGFSGGRSSPTPGSRRSATPAASVALLLTDGKTLVIGTWRFNHAWLTSWLGKEVAAFRARPDTLGLADVLARGERPVEQWVREAARTLDTRDAYRSGAVLRDQLLDLAEDASAEETSRVGAAVALRPTMDPDCRRRLVAAAETSVSPRVRVALGAAAAAADDDEVMEALRVYETAEARRS